MVADGAGVRFTINSLKMQHICWGAEMWYRRSAIHNARKVNGWLHQSLHSKVCTGEWWSAFGSEVCTWFVVMFSTR